MFQANPGSMNTLVLVRKELSGYFDFSFFIRFLLILLVLYYLNKFYIDLVDHKGFFYSAFFDQFLNYPNWMKRVLLNTSNALTHAFGYNTYVEGIRKLVIPGRPALILGMPCVGLNMLILWAAFVNAHRHNWKKNLLWTVGGITAICIINCFRITLMVAAVSGRWNVNRFLDHHDLFKLAAYSFILLMMFLYNHYYTLQKTGFRFNPIKLFQKPMPAGMGF